MNNEYFQTKSKTFAYAIQYATGRNFYKFNDKEGNVVYSFIADEELRKKIRKINEIRFN